MMTLLQRRGLKVFHPILKRLVKHYLSKPRNYTYKSIQVRVMPGVFHPGFFFSTKMLLEFLNDLDLEGKRLLELGAGSGLISIFCAKKNAVVTASDINQVALNQLKLNAKRNDVKVEVRESDLFDQLDENDFDFIIINPPYYPKNPQSVEEQAWFCGEEFDYFKKLFSQLKSFDSSKTDVYLILSEDCEIETIKSIAAEKELVFDMVYQKRISGEKNCIYKLLNSSLN